MHTIFSQTPIEFPEINAKPSLKQTCSANIVILEIVGEKLPKVFFSSKRLYQPVGSMEWETRTQMS